MLQKLPSLWPTQSLRSFLQEPVFAGRVQLENSRIDRSPLQLGFRHSSLWSNSGSESPGMVWTLPSILEHKHHPKQKVLDRCILCSSSENKSEITFTPEIPDLNLRLSHTPRILEHTFNTEYLKLLWSLLISHIRHTLRIWYLKEAKPNHLLCSRYSVNTFLTHPHTPDTHLRIFGIADASHSQKSNNPLGMLTLRHTVLCL